MEYIFYNTDVLFICGPTGVGKTAIADELVSRMGNVHIVNMDMGQMYTPLNIGTAKPDLASVPYKHHLFNIIDTPQDFSAAQYRQRLIDTIAQVRSENKKPIVVGGTFFYLQSILFALPEYKNIISQEKIWGSWDDLHAIDPARALCIHRNDQYRIDRALAIWHMMGTLPSMHKNVYTAPPFNYQILYITRERADLYERINKRVMMMINDGLMQEVTSLLNTPWQEFLIKKKIIGYDVFMDINLDLATKISLVQQQTRNYAKRQETFWKGLKKKLVTTGMHHQLHELNLTFGDLDLYLKQLNQL